MTATIPPTRLRPPASLGALVLACAWLWAPAAALAAEGIHVSGTGIVTAVPDMGEVRLHVRREGKDPAGLTAQLDEVVAEVLALTRQFGIEDRDVTAAVVSIQPRYRRQGNDTVVEGVVATRTITVTLRKLDDFPELLSDALAAGVNNADPIRLDIDPERRAALEHQALDLAMTDARRQAEQVAKGFDVAVGSVLDVQTSLRSVQPRMAVEQLAAAKADVFEPGSMDIEQSVQATFAIIPNG